MNSMNARVKQKKSITRHLYPSRISLKEFYEKVEKEEFEHHLKLLKDQKNKKKEVFEILTVLGKGRTSFTFLSLFEKKLTALRMSYDDEDFTGKFDSVIEYMGEEYKKSFLDVLYPSMPVQRLYYGKIPKKTNEIEFDKTVYVSFWEKADALLEDMLDQDFEKKFRWFREFLRGLCIIHSKNRAHFDIKLENLFLVHDHLKIGDFEFYWKVKDFIDSKEYLYCGSIGYIAPEMFYDRENITSKVDIFSAGVAFARLFTGEAYRKMRLNAEENRQISSILQKCETLDCFDSSHLAEIKESLRHSFFYNRLVRDKIKKGELNAQERFLYEEILLEMLNPEPADRIDINKLVDKLGIKEPAFQEREQTSSIVPGKPANLLVWWVIVGVVLIAAAGLSFYFFKDTNEKSRYPSPTAKVKLTIKSPGEIKSKIPHKTRQQETKKPGQEKIEDISPKDKPFKRSGSESPPIKTTIPEIPPGQEKEKLKDLAKFEAYLDIARTLMKEKEYKKALDMINQAREIKETEELLELEQTITLLMAKEVLDSYKKYYLEAQRLYQLGSYEEALKNIEIARKIKDTPGLDSLELRVKRKITERNEEYERGLALVKENIVNGDYLYARELINSLKKIKVDDRILEFEKVVKQMLTILAQQQQELEKEFINYLQKAQEFIDQGDYNKAEEEIQRARKIKNNELLKRLEEKLKDLKEQNRRDYEKYNKWARIYYENGQLEQALQYLELAKEIYRSHELVVLEREIREKAREQEREKAEIKADDEAYADAVSRGEIWDFDEYIRNYPFGRHVQEARERLRVMLAHFIPAIEETRVIKKDELVYLRGGRRKRVSGIVRLEVVIDIHGNVTGVDASDGDWMLKREAIKDVKQLKFEPFIIGGEPRVVRFPVKMVFGQPTEDSL